MRTRATVGFVIIIAAIAALSITSLWAFSQRQAEYDNRQLLRGISDKMKAAMQQPDWQARLTALAQQPDVRDKHVVLMVAGRDQGVIWTSEADHPEWPPNRDDQTWRAAPRDIGHGRVVLAGRLQKLVLRDVKTREMDMLIAAGFLLIVVGVGAWLVVGKTLSPIRKLANQAANASVENLDVRLQPPSADIEVVELVDTLNELLERISQTAESKGRFYAAASHELRTPLTALSGHLELALSRERSAEEYKAALEEARAQSKRLKSLVQSLLLLHQLENNAPQDREVADLSAIVRSTLQTFEPLVAQRSLHVDLQLPEEALVSAIPNHAEMLVRNLLENAVKYASEHKHVRVAVHNEGGRTTLEVYDDCETIPNWTPDKAFEAFYRPDAARNAKTGGNGLGLAICRAIARANGWEMQVQPEENGFRVLVRFAALPAEPQPKRPRARRASAAEAAG